MTINTRVIMWSIWFLLLTQLSVYETADDDETDPGACNQPASHHHHHHHHHHHRRRHHSEIHEPSQNPENDDFFARKYNSWPNFGRCSLPEPEFNNPPTRRRWTFGGYGTKTNCPTKEEKQRQKQEKERKKEEKEIRKVQQKTEKLKQKMEKSNQEWEKEQAKMKEEKSKLMRQMLASTCPRNRRLFRKTL